MTRHFPDLGSARNGFQEGLHPGGTYSRNKKCASKLAIPVLIKMHFKFTRFFKLQNVNKSSSFQFKLEGGGGLNPGELITGCIFLFTGRWAYNWGVARKWRGVLKDGNLDHRTQILQKKPSVQIFPSHAVLFLNFSSFLLTYLRLQSG